MGKAKEIKASYSKNSSGFEEWHEYDAAGNEIHYKNSSGYERWCEYDSAGNEVHYKDSNGYEWWREYDSAGNEVHYRSSAGYEEWREYDSAGNEVHYRNSAGNEVWREYDSAGNEVHRRDSDGYVEWREYDGYYRAIGREIPEVPVSALAPERKKAFDKSEYYAHAAEKESVDFVKTRYKDKAEYWNKVFRREPVSRELEERCGPDHEFTVCDHYIHVRHKLEENLKAKTYSHETEILQKRLDYLERAAREEIKVNALAQSLDSAVPLLGKKEQEGVSLEDSSGPDVHKLGADEEYDEEDLEGIKPRYGLDDSWER